MKNKYSTFISNLYYIYKGKALDKSKLVYVQRPMHRNGKLSYTHKWVKPDAVQDTDIVKENKNLLPTKHKALKNKPPKEEKPVKKPKPTKEEKPVKKPKPTKEEKPVKKPKPTKEEKPVIEETPVEDRKDDFKLNLNKNEYIQKMFPQQNYYNDPKFLEDSAKYKDIITSVCKQSGIDFHTGWQYGTFEFEHTQKPIIGGMNFGNKKIRVGILPQGVSKLKSGKTHRNYIYFTYDKDKPEEMHRYQHLHELLEGVFGKNLGSAILEQAHKHNPELSQQLSQEFRDTREHYELNGRKDNSDQFGFDYSSDGKKLPKGSKNPVFGELIKASASYSKENKISHNQDPKKVLFQVGSDPENIGHARKHGGRLGYSDTEHGTDLWWVYDHGDKVSKMKEKFGEPLGTLRDTLQLHKPTPKRAKDTQRENRRQETSSPVKQPSTPPPPPQNFEKQPKPSTPQTYKFLHHKEYLEDGHGFSDAAIQRLGLEKDVGGVYIPEGYKVDRIPPQVSRWRKAINRL